MQNIILLFATYENMQFLLQFFLLSFIFLNYNLKIELTITYLKIQHLNIMQHYSHFRVIFYLLITFAFVLISCSKSAEKNLPKKDKASNKSSIIDKDKPDENKLSSQDVFRAALDGDIRGVKSIIEKGVLADTIDKNGRTPLMLASFNGHIEILNLLLKAGAKVNTRDAIGRTALMYASSGPFPSVVTLLCKHGAEVNAVDSQEGWTALMFAAAEGQKENVQILLDNNANPKIEDCDGDNAATFAFQKGHNEIAVMLK